MVDYKYKDLYKKPHIDKQIKIAADDGSVTFTNQDIHWEEFELKESLCSESELQFGLCEMSTLGFRISNVFIPLTGKRLTVTEILEGNIDVPFQYGQYKVFSDIPTADRKYRDVTAYDAMYDIINAEMSGWYNKLLPNKQSRTTMKQFRTSFIHHFGLEEKEIELINDDMIVEKTIEPEQLSGKDVITSICEINGCFGHIGRDGKFHYIYLPQDMMGLYPSNTLFPDHAPDYLPQSETGHLYPQDPKSEKIGTGTYIGCQYEDFICKRINKIQIRQEENDIGAIYPETQLNTQENCYIIEDNFLVYGKSAAQLKEIAKRLLDKITNIVYRPANVEAVGNPCFEVGDAIRLSTKYELIETYILQRTLKGIQAKRDTYTASGAERHAENVNSISKSIIQLKGKTNTLIRNVDETKSEIKDVEAGLTSTISQTASQIRTEIADTANGLQSKITQNANSITAEVTRATAAEGQLSSRITINANSITAEVTRATAAEGNLSSRVQINADSITSEVTRAKGAESTLSSSITQTATQIRAEVKDTKEGLQSSITQNANSITAEVTRAKGAEGSLSSRITINENGISTKVTKGNVVSEINQSAEAIVLSAGRLIVESGNFQIDHAGNVSMTGKINATSGKIAGFIIEGNRLVNDSGGGTNIWHDLLETTVVRTRDIRVGSITPEEGSNTMTIGENSSTDIDMWGRVYFNGSVTIAGNNMSSWMSTIETRLSNIEVEISSLSSRVSSLSSRVSALESK